jgi:hypothetical protein
MVFDLLEYTDTNKNFLKHTINCEETWVYGFLALKISNLYIENALPHHEHPQNICQVYSKTKGMLTVFFNDNCAKHHECAPQHFHI